MQEQKHLDPSAQHQREVQYMSVAADTGAKEELILPEQKDLAPLKVVALDLDGTTLREDKTFSPRLIKDIAVLQERGVTVAICSGRAPESVLTFSRQLKLDQYSGYCVCFNGGALINLKDITKDLFVSTLDATDLIDIEAQARLHGCAVHAYSTRRVLLTESNIKFTEMEIAASMQPFEKILFPDEVRPDEQVYKLIAVGETEHLEEMRCNLPAEFHTRFNIARTHSNFLEFMQKGCSKGATLDQLCKLIGCSLENVVAFGDAENDIEMVRMSGVGVAVANAMDTLKAVTPYRTYNYMADGVAIYLEKLFGLPAGDAEA